MRLPLDWYPLMAIVYWNSYHVVDNWLGEMVAGEGSSPGNWSGVAGRSALGEVVAAKMR